MSKEPVQCWKTSDGEVHETKGAAIDHEFKIEAVDTIAKMLTDTEEVLLNSGDAQHLAEYLVRHEDGLTIAKLVVAVNS